MKKWVIGSILAVVILGGGGYAGYHYAINLAADKISQELSKELAQNPQLAGELDKLVNNNDPQQGKSGSPSSSAQPNNGQSGNSASAPGSTPNTGDSGSQQGQASAQSGNTGGASESAKDAAAQQGKDLQIKNKQDAIAFVMSRLTASEMKQAMQLATSGDLTPEKKAELKKIAYSKFTPEEIEAVRKVVGK